MNEAKFRSLEHEAFEAPCFGLLDAENLRFVQNDAGALTIGNISLRFTAMLGDLRVIGTACWNDFALKH